ncbi:methyltransferase domain-containing protein [Polynucleobacter sp. MWH-Braz-FAM2G]|uniref:class I SAM-dependent methyltransferase n=1 Tax=Polynucleobacter sp. MWH-Braz-FAM2G TaxID=1855883 RepID=UPI001BFCD901|nr:methyltransferase domain-containing protein [Polynucleobacter sp. MWH-Braz-FAM2G]QWD91088.1 class I SAM-dependent methyltransferase [Polynucleobacter sp. MWH-Braz-FAM2G]
MKKIKINIGCASRPLSGYINIDLDTIEQIRARYPNITIPENIEIFQYDIYALPFENSTVAEVRCDSLLEHLSFIEEKKFFYEARRVLCKGGKLIFSVPDFEDTVRKWLAAEDDWKDFFRDDPEAIELEHWFGQYSYSTSNRWGYLTASLFGPQNSLGQFHKNCYTEKKIQNLLAKIGFEITKLDRYQWKVDRDLMIQVEAQKVCL